MESTEVTTRRPGDTIRTGFLGGRLSLAQPRRGYRAGMDAALLAAACDAGRGQRVIEAGCGPGAALLSAAVRRPESRFVGIERDPEALALCLQNIAANGLQERVEALEGDVGRKLSALGLEPFDAALANPPFFDDPDAIRGPAPEREGAWIAEGGLEAWTRFLLKAVREGGTITMIHRADRLADILALLGKGAGSFRIRLTYSKGRSRGHWREWRGIKLMPTFHPAYVLRSYTNEVRAAVWDDLKKVMAEVGLPPPKQRPPS